MSAPGLLDRCPRCGGHFHCGIDDSAACACTTIALGDAALAQLRRRYNGCLCLNCLRLLAGHPAADSAVAPVPGPG